MSITGAIYKRLAGDARIGVHAEGVYRGQAARSARRYLTVIRVDSISHRHQTGGPSLRQARLQIDSWAETEAAAERMAKAVETCLDRFRGSLGDDDGSVHAVRRILLDTERELHEPPRSGGSEQVCRVSQDYIVWHAS